MDADTDNDEYIIVDFTPEELQLISERAEYMAQIDEVHSFWKQMFWQLALSANHLSIMMQQENGLKSVDIKQDEYVAKEKED